MHLLRDFRTARMPDAIVRKMSQDLRGGRAEPVREIPAIALTPAMNCTLVCVIYGANDVARFVDDTAKCTDGQGDAVSELGLDAFDHYTSS